MKLQNNHITYVELKAKNLEKIKGFYSQTFDWKFTDYGPTYTSFSESGIAGGFETSDDEIVNGVLLVLYHKDLEKIKQKIIKSKGIIAKSIFSFPGGRRFHFIDPAGNELAVWSDT